MLKTLTCPCGKEFTYDHKRGPERTFCSNICYIRDRNKKRYIPTYKNSRPKNSRRSSRVEINGDPNYFNAIYCC